MHLYSFKLERFIALMKLGFLLTAQPELLRQMQSLMLVSELSPDPHECLGMQFSFILLFHRQAVS